MRIDVALRTAVARLSAAGVSSPQWDAEQLLAHVVGVSRSQLVPDRDLDADQSRSYDELVGRRAAREPLQYLTGVVGFRYIDLEVGPGVFIPRPETEVVAGIAIELAGERSAPIVVDVCSGSGAIALSVANELPAATVHAVELSDSALQWLRRNSDQRKAAGDSPVVVHQSDVLAAVPDLDGSVDVVVANPPYVTDEELEAVEPEVRDHDPRAALVAGEDGLDVIRRVVAASERLLRPGGWVVIEHSDRQGTTCPAVLTGRGGWTDVADHADLSGRPRCAVGRWTGRS